MTDHRDLVTAAAASDGLTIAPAALVAAVCFYTSWRISSAASPTWLVAGTAVFGVHSVSLAALQVTNPQLTAVQHTWMALADLVLLSTVLALRAVGSTSTLHRYPTAVGATAGLLVGLLRVTAVSRFPRVEPAFPGRVLVAVAGIVLAGALAMLVLRAAPVPLVVRERIVAALLLLTAGHAVSAVDGPGQHALNTFASLGCSVAAAIAFFGAATGMLRRTLLEESGARTKLRSRLEVVEEDERRHRARIHEIESMMAGIVCASELLRQRQDIPAERRLHLEEMIHEELGRLERLLRAAHHARQSAGGVHLASVGTEGSGGSEVSAVSEVSEVSEVSDGSGPWDALGDAGDTVSVPMAPTATVAPGEPVSVTVDLDRTIGHLALVHEAKGTTVAWRPSGRQANADPDDVSEVLNILLDNAARHGDAQASVSVRELPHGIEILVSDHGPGIAPEIRDRLFQWGARGPASPGQGIGLHIAHDLMTRAGGYLRLGGSGRPGEPGSTGTTFVVGLRKAEPGLRVGLDRDPDAGIDTAVGALVAVEAARREIGDGVLA